MRQTEHPMKTHGRSLVRLVRSTIGEPTRGAEIGVWTGQTTAGLLSVFPGLTLYAIDPWDTGEHNPTMPATEKQLRDVEKQFRDATAFAQERCQVLKMNSARASQWVADASLDFFYIDAVHTYEHVKQDVNIWVRKLRAGGLACGHDYAGRGDRKGFFGVAKAVDEWAAQRGVTIQVARGHNWWVVL